MRSMEALRSLSDPVLTAIGFGFVFALIGTSEVAKRLLGLGEEGSRKLVHVGVGHWILLALFIDSMAWAVIAPVVFIGLNYVSHRKGTFGAMERSGGDTLGTVYYSVALTVIVLWLWRAGEPRWVGVVGIGVMAWGDGLAATVGQRWGRRHYRGPGGPKTVEGSATMFVVSLVVIGLGQHFGPDELRPLVAVLVAAMATTMEALSPRGTDNLTVPLGTAGLLTLLTLL